MVQYLVTVTFEHQFFWLMLKDDKKIKTKIWGETVVHIQALQRKYINTHTVTNVKQKPEKDHI